MKTLLTFIIIVAAQLTCFSKFHEAKIVFADGKSRSGFAESDFGGKYLLFKASEKAEAEKIETASLSKIIYKIDNETFEYHRLKVYLGWGQKRISDPSWLEVVERGIATLYVIRTTMSSANGMNKAGFQDYYCIREGEPAAKMIANISSANNNQTFRAKAPLYFEDYPELAEKIKSKEYTWKDLVPVVKEYNKWAAAKNKKKK
jgi:hypothetical protein